MTEIKWKEWSKEVFRESKKLKKPILLDISAVWCHWCHTMDREAYSDRAVIDFINSNLIPVRVDTDQRPEVNERYNMGGWPTTALLDSNGEVIIGATYIPTNQMIPLLKSGISYFEKGIRTGKHDYPKQIKADKIKPLIPEMLKIVNSFYDPEYHGFGVEPKFPHFEILNFLIHVLRQKIDKKLNSMLANSLNAMVNSELWDQTEGGFYRYSTQQNWTIPHFEKMLEDNAQHLQIYLSAYELTEAKKYKEVSEGIIKFLLSILYDPKKGYFYGSQDADEEYCHLSHEQRKTVEPPFVDKTMFADWNCLTASAFLKASKVLGSKKYEDIALKTLKFILDNNKKEFQHYIKNNKSSGPVLFRDHVHLFNALLNAYECTKDKDWLKKAEKVLDLIYKNFFDKEGGFFDINKADHLGELSGRRKNLQDNALFAITLLKHTSITGKDHTKDLQNLFLALIPSAQNYGPFAAMLAVAVDLFENSGNCKDGYCGK